MVSTVKFSEFLAAGDLNNSSVTVGLSVGVNASFTNPWTFLPPGATGDRPTPAADNYYRLRLNTTMQLYEYYDPVALAWVQVPNTIGTTLGVIGTANQVLANGTSGIIEYGVVTLTTPQDIGITSTPTFAGLVLSGPLSPQYGGTGIANGVGSTITLGGALSLVGGFTTTFNITGNTNVTFPNSGTLAVVGGSVTSVSGTLNRISVTAGTTPVVDIDAAYIGQGSITTLGTIISGTWHGTAIDLATYVSGNLAVTHLDSGTSAGNTTFWRGDGVWAVPPGGGITPAALTKVDDTNITLTLGGTPATALLQATSITAGWTGQLAETRGGTAQSTYTLGDTLYSSAANTLQKLAGNTTIVKQYLSQTGTGLVSAAPVWATITGADITGDALTKVDDTNVTLTLGGTPATALLRAASLTLGWTGQLSVQRGGTGLAAATLHYLLIGNGTSPLTLLAPSATSGVPLISQGIASDPAYGTAVVAGGGTGNTTFTAYSVICAGTTATGAFQNVTGLGTAGEQLTSNGPGALPTWQASGGVTPAAMTKVDDTNVTLTLGGTPATSLLQATSLTLGWTGQLGLTRGGTNASLTASNGGIIYSTAAAFAVLAGTATAGQILQSGASAAPSWSTTTYPATNAINTMMYASSANVQGIISAANSSVLVTSSTGVPSMSGAMTNGQVIIGSTGATPTASTLSAGTGISIANAAGTITISAVGSGESWVDVSGTSQSMVVNTGYTANNAGLVTLTLPATAAYGSVVSVIGVGAGGWKIAQNAGQTIHLGNTPTTAGVGGSLASTNQWDSIELLCVTANTTWSCLNGPQGIITVV